jgi:hypothetical protein
MSSSQTGRATVGICGISEEQTDQQGSSLDMLHDATTAGMRKGFKNDRLESEEANSDGRMEL